MQVRVRAHYAIPADAGEQLQALRCSLEEPNESDSLRTLLLEHGYEPGDVTLFRGDNVGPDAARALEQWEADEGQAIAPSHRPSLSTW